MTEVGEQDRPWFAGFSLICVEYLASRAVAHLQRTAANKVID
jgi:hypothetical protein